MPAVPRACIETWRTHNPGWELNVLTGETMRAYVDPELCKAAAQAQVPYRLSELVRLDLLHRHGGVWVDATCWCARPLDDWIFSVTESGFFAFQHPGPDRLAASWFLASEPGHPIIQKMRKRLADRYLGHPYVDTGWRRRAQRHVGRALNRRVATTGLWFAWPLPQMGISPYFAFHYTFNRLVRTDPSAQAAWNRVPVVSANGPLSLFANRLAWPPSESVLADLHLHRTPVFKLNWRDDPNTFSAESTLRVLLSLSACD